MSDLQKVRIEFSDRYSATGTPRPQPETVCKGRCEGMGCYPTKDRSRWPKKAKSKSGWFFVTCEVCGGTGVRTNSHSAGVAAKAILRQLRDAGLLKKPTTWEIYRGAAAALEEFMKCRS